MHSEKHCCHGWRQERWRRREGAAPGSYSLYQIPPSTRLNNDDVVSETDSEIRKIKRKTLRYGLPNRNLVPLLGFTSLVL